jgi:hypothetical protein
MLQSQFLSRNLLLDLYDGEQFFKMPSNRLPYPHLLTFDRQSTDVPMP